MTSTEAPVVAPVEARMESLGDLTTRAPRAANRDHDAPAGDEALAGEAEAAAGLDGRPVDAAVLVAAALCAHGAWIGPGWARGAEPVALLGVSLALGAALVLALRVGTRRSALAVLPLVWGAAAALDLGPEDGRGLAWALAASLATLALAAQHAARARRTLEAVAWSSTAPVRAATVGGAWSGPLAAVLIVGAAGPPALRLAHRAWPSAGADPLASTMGGVAAAGPSAGGAWGAGLVAVGLGIGLWLAHGVLTPPSPRRADGGRRLVWTLLAAALLGGAWWLRRHPGGAA